MCVKVYVSAHVYMFMTFHNGFMSFCCISYIYIYIYILQIYICVSINRHGSHNIRNGIASAQTGHGTFTNSNR